MLLEYNITTCFLFLFFVCPLVQSDSVYWDKDKKTFGETEVEVASTDTSPTLITRNMLIRHVKVALQRPHL